MTIRIEGLGELGYAGVTASGGEPIPPTSPGDILRHDFMEPLGRSANALARELHVTTNRVTGVLYASRRVTADTALRLARHFGATPQFWLGLQNQYDLALAGAERGGVLEHEITPLTVAGGWCRRKAEVMPTGASQYVAPCPLSAQRAALSRHRRTFSPGG